jgi:hypothetical protein
MERGRPKCNGLMNDTAKSVADAGDGLGVVRSSVLLQNYHNCHTECTF